MLFRSPTLAMSTTTMTDDDAPTSAYATPMSSIISLYPAAPDALDENCVVGLFLASTSTAWSGSPLLQSQQHLPSPIHYPPTTPLQIQSLFNTNTGCCCTPISSTCTDFDVFSGCAFHHSFYNSTFTSNSKTTI